MQIAIIDYGAGNLRSVARAFAKLGQEPRVTHDPKAVRRADVVVLPGVGAAADMMQSLASLGMLEAIRETIAADRPFFGICMGLEVLLTVSEEGGEHPCLNILPGRVRRLPEGRKIPHMGWNQVRQVAPHPVFEGIADGANFYFVHSYYADPEERSWVVGETDYGLAFASIVAHGSLVATQFHPEKSGVVGLRMYENFLRHIAGAQTGGQPWR